MKLLLVLACVFLPAYTKQLDYYWRDYTGELPSDAVHGGTDKNNDVTYIAQVYIAGHGVFPTQLYKGEKSVTASRFGVHRSDLFIKILCSAQPEKLSWMPVTAAKLHIDAIGKHLVIGGTENGKILNIGRVFYQNEVTVGKVCGYNVGDALLYFPREDKEVSASSYEVLVYEDNTINFDTRMGMTSE